MRKEFVAPGYSEITEADAASGLYRGQRVYFTGRQRYRQPILFNTIACEYILGFLDLAGEDFQARMDHLNERLPGISYRQKSDWKDEYYSFYGYRNTTLCIEGLALAFQGQAPGKEHVIALKAYRDWMILPMALRYYAVDFIGQAARAEEPQRIIDEFPELCGHLVHPAFRKRFSELGIMAADIRETLRAHPEIDPIDASYFLTGASFPNEITAELKFAVARDLSAFAQILLGSTLSDGENAADVLLGLNKSTVAREFFVSPVEKHHMVYRLGTFAPLLPLESGPTLLQKRRQAARRFFRYHAGLNPDRESGLSDERLIARAASSSENLNMEKYFKLLYGSVPAKFSHMHIKMMDRHTQHEWSEVNPDLRERLEAAGLKSESVIARRLATIPGLHDVLRDVGIILHVSRDEAGYAANFREVIQALLHPERALFAGGLLPDPFYVTLHELAGGQPDFDTFWGVTRAEPKNAEQHFAIALHTRITDAIKQDDKLSGAVTNAQIAELLGMARDQYAGLFERPYMNYFLPRNSSQPEASVAMQIIEQRLGLSFREEWQQLHEERVGAMKAQEQRAAAELAARQRAAAAQPKAPPDPWKGVDETVAATIKARFETPQALADAIFENIRALATLDARVATRLPGAIAQEVDQMLRSKVAGVSGDYLPLDIMHARILAAMGPEQRALAKAIFESRPKAQGLDLFKQTALANITALAVQNPRLATFLNWRQLRNAHSRANVADLSENVFSAYTIRSQRDLTLNVRDSLAGVVETLNTGLDSSARCNPEGIVPVHIWRSAAKARSGLDPIPAYINANNYRLAPG
jgi:hypothetical protein